MVKILSVSKISYISDMVVVRNGERQEHLTVKNFRVVTQRLFGKNSENVQNRWKFRVATPSASDPW
jgi:hypothetical protein